MTVPIAHEPIEQYRLFWIFVPPTGRTWHMTLDSFQQALLAREPEAFTNVWVQPGMGSTADRAVMSFGITLGDEVVEGIAGVRSEGASISLATAAQAAEFAGWLDREIVPSGESIEFSTREGIEAEFADVVLDDLSPEPLRAVLLDHVRQIDASR